MSLLTENPIVLGILLCSLLFGLLSTTSSGQSVIVQSYAFVLQCIFSLKVNVFKEGSSHNLIVINKSSID